MYTILGATGNVGSKVADILIKKGEKVRLVARSASRLRPLVSRNAQAYAGDITDLEFLSKALAGSKAVLTLLPPNFKADNFMQYAGIIGESIAKAVELAKVTHMVNLSSWGADLAEKTGNVKGLHSLEERLNRIKGINVLHIRSANYMENALMNIDLIKSKGINGSPLRGDFKFPMIATKDIAAVIADRLVKRDFSGAAIQVLLGQRDLSMIEATAIIGKKIGKPELAYVMFPYGETEKNLLAMGFSSEMSGLFIEMTKAINDGRLSATVKRTKANTTPTSFEQFCDEVLVPLYQQKKAA